MITPHDGGWRIKKNVTPSDWVSPVPIHFLGVKEGAKFQFAVAPRAGAGAGAGEDDVKDAYQLIEEALEWIGAGAKTSVGFGRAISQEKVAEIDAASPPKPGDKVRVLETDKNQKWHGAVGEVLDNPPINELLKVKRDPDENGKRPERYIAIVDLVRVASEKP